MGGAMAMDFKVAVMGADENHLVCGAAVSLALSAAFLALTSAAFLAASAACASSPIHAAFALASSATSRPKAWSTPMAMSLLPSPFK